MTSRALIAHRPMTARLVHINAMRGITPLVGGYLKSYALEADGVADTWTIDLVSITIEQTVDEIVEAIAPPDSPDPDLIGFSTYVWNFKLVMGALKRLRARFPDALFLLGGVEVMNRAESLLTPETTNVLVCNGEGEVTFRQLLVELGAEEPDVSRVGGISYVGPDGAIVATEPNERIKTLDDIHSPYLKGYFAPRDLGIALMETNRGCPYHCSYCFWGGAVGQKIHRLGRDRVEEEIEYLGRNQCRSVLLCDANFGIFPADIGYAEKFVESRRINGFPMRVRYSSAKNNLERSLNVASILAEGKILTCQPISLQTLSADALKKANRDNIDQATYLALQRRTNELGLASFIEIIWPLPGETLDTFKDGLARLAQGGAQAFAIYPLLWLNNVGFQGREKELQVETWAADDAAGSGRNVVSTREVPFEDYLDGLMYGAAMQLLHDARGLANTMTLLDRIGIASMRAVCELFMEFMDRQQGQGAFACLWEAGREQFRVIRSNITWPGSLIYYALHEDRAGFDQIIRRFVQENRGLFTFLAGSPDPAGVARSVDAMIEFDLLARPYVYTNSEVVLPQGLVQLTLQGTTSRGCMVDVPLHVDEVLDTARLTGSTGEVWQPTFTSTRYEFDHSVNQGAHLAAKTREDHYDECRLYATEIGNFSATWRAVVMSTKESR